MPNDFAFPNDHWVIQGMNNASVTADPPPMFFTTPAKTVELLNTARAELHAQIIPKLSRAEDEADLAELLLELDGYGDFTIVTLMSTEEIEIAVDWTTKRGTFRIHREPTKTWRETFERRGLAA